MINLGDAIAQRDNDYDQILQEYEIRSHQSWSQQASLNNGRDRTISIVIPARNVAYCLSIVLDALHAAHTSSSMEILVIDDGSQDGTAELARSHPIHPKVVILPRRFGPSVARNVGTLLAKGETVLFLDADMVLPPHVIHEHAARGLGNLILIGFRHNIPVEDATSPSILGHRVPDIEADHRVNWYANPGRLLYTGTVIDRPIRARPLDDTRELRALGYGSTYYDWDLPRMVVTAMVSMPRAAVIDVGGFDPEFAQGWGVEDTHLGAKLIAVGLKVVPLRTAVGFHVDPPDASEQWKQKSAVWPRNIALYRQRLTEPVPSNQATSFLDSVDEVLQESEVC